MLPTVSAERDHVHAAFGKSVVEAHGASTVERLMRTVDG
jgi:hypothetical protein